MATPRIGTECTFRKIPPEIREEIFKLVVIEWTARAPHHPSRYQPNAGYGEKWGVKEKRSSRCPSLERALVADRGLYREFFAARVKLQSIRVNQATKPFLLCSLSSLAQKSLKTVVLYIRPYGDSTLWPKCTKGYPQKKVDHLLDLAIGGLKNDLVHARSLKHLVIEFSAPLNAMEPTNRKWNVVNMSCKKLFRDDTLGTFVNGLPNISSIEFRSGRKYESGVQKAEFLSLVDLLEKRLNNVGSKFGGIYFPPSADIRYTTFRTQGLKKITWKFEDFGDDAEGSVDGAEQPTSG